MARYLACGAMVTQLAYKGSKEGIKKPSAPKIAWRALRKSSGKLYKLFSSFLRGASCPKSPRVAATAASLFMLEKAGDVKSKSLKTKLTGKMVTTNRAFAASNTEG
jgi:hypothetical protein